MSAKAGHEVLKIPSSFANTIHCLSNTQFYYREWTLAILYRSVSGDVRKHVGMLDGIALLITIGSEKVVATGLLQKAGITQIVWATRWLYNQSCQYLCGGILATPTAYGLRCADTEIL